MDARIIVLAFIATVCTVAKTQIYSGNASQLQLPYHVSIEACTHGEEMKNATWQHRCSGAILTDLFIITTANCVSTSQIRVSTGTIFANNNDATRKVAKNYIYPQKHYFRNNIALLLLKKRVLFDQMVQAVVLPEMHINGVGGNYVTSGWGYTYTWAFSVAPQLQYTNITLLHNDACYKYLILANYGHYAFLNATSLCTEIRMETPSHGYEDEGSPLTQQTTDTNGTATYTLYAILNWSPGRISNITGPSVYSKIDYYTRWIKKTMRIGKSEWKTWRLLRGTNRGHVKNGDIVKRENNTQISSN